MGLSKLSVSLLALASSAIGADLPAITAKVSHFFVSRTPTISLLVGINRGEGNPEDDQQVRISISGATANRPLFFYV
jgi:hypothetical protein